jgi:hypothetical protein
VRIAVAVLTLFCLIHSAHAFKFNERFGEGRIGAGMDVIRDKGNVVAIATLAPASVLVWGHNAGFALAYPFAKRNGLNGSFGGILVKNLNQEVGTHLNFYGTLSFCGERICLSFAHISHGKGIFDIREDAPNGGLNFLLLEYRYR